MGLPLVSRLPEEYGPPTISINGAGWRVQHLRSAAADRAARPVELDCPGDGRLLLAEGRHFLKFGAELDRRGVTFGQARAPRGSFTFDGTYTGSRSPISCSATFAATTSTPRTPIPTCTTIGMRCSANDDWKVTPRLTLNSRPALRLFPAIQAEGRQVRQHRAERLRRREHRHTKTSQLRPRTDGSPTAITSGPRFGFAWRPPSSAKP